MFRETIGILAEIAPGVKHLVGLKPNEISQKALPPCFFILFIFPFGFSRRYLGVHEFSPDDEVEAGRIIDQVLIEQLTGCPPVDSSLLPLSLIEPVKGTNLGDEAIQVSPNIEWPTINEFTKELGKERIATYIKVSYSYLKH
ncbi:unnamed protein product [Protopolystoma xenopodis]|uniref:Uncharacterized protein n=1 Tax=Protopolystoma xenopodis TaxID=117903 RepID=A0A3S5FEF0_9PLAT|nr:unnamed protein product [Protopolystoma xenopodis]